MNSTPENKTSGLPIYDAGNESTYSLEILTELTGVSAKTVIHYQEEGLISGESYGDEAVHTLRRIEHLRGTCEPNLSGIKLILGLMDEVERLQTALRMRH